MCGPKCLIMFSECLQSLPFYRLQMSLKAASDRALVASGSSWRDLSSHTCYVTGLALAIPARSESAWIGTPKGLISLEFLSAVGPLAFGLLIAGFCIWLFERKTNAEEFGHDDVKHGLGD